jgi:hypothetical protein
MIDDLTRDTLINKMRRREERRRRIHALVRAKKIAIQASPGLDDTRSCKPGRRQSLK